MSEEANIKVICRFRPINEKEKFSFSEKSCVQYLDENSVQILQYGESTPLSFKFDHIFPSNSSQSEVYEISAKPIVESVMQGFNGTVFAYGQTASGKTYTMTGFPEDSGQGIIPRMVSTVFKEIENSGSKVEFQVKVGYCEIYLEKIRDLLDPSKTNLKVHEDRTRGIYISDLTEIYVGSDEEVYHLMKVGNTAREKAYTNMNSESSRSHSIFILTVSQTNLIDFSSRTGKLFLVDLAGSEKVAKTGAEGKRLEEAKNINKSLTMLGNVITALTDGKSSHVPYRDSKLTRVLQDSLGGNSKTVLIITCSPSAYNESETVSTLKFGVRAKNIKNSPKINKEPTIGELKLMLSQAKEEIIKRDKIIAMLKGKNEVVEYEEKEDEKEEVYLKTIIELEDTGRKLADLEALNRRLLNIIEDLKEDNEQMKEDHGFICSQIGELQGKLLISEENLASQVIEIESLKSELAAEIQKKAELESQLIQQNSKLEEGISERQKNLQEDKAKLQETLGEEKQKNQEIKQELQKITNELRQNLSKEKKMKVLEQSFLAEKERWEKENRSLNSEIELAVKKVVQLQIQLEEAGKKYSVLESTLSEGEFAMKKRCEYLQRNLEQLNLMYHQMVALQSSLKVNKAVAEKKAARLQGKLDLCEKENKGLKERNSEFEKENKELKEKVEQIGGYVGTRNGVWGKNIRKVIRGGGYLEGWRPNTSVFGDVLGEDEEEFQ